MLTCRRHQIVMLLTLALALSASVAQAQTTAAPAVAAVNPVRVFNEIQEFKDLNAKLEQERKDVETKGRDFQRQIKELEDARNLLRADSPQYQEAQQKYLQKAVEYRAWLELTQADQQRRYKQEMFRLFEKVKTGIGELAAQRGIGIVVARKTPEFDIEKLNIDQLKNVIVGQDVLYVADGNDITEDVIALLDAKYKQGQ